MSTTIKNWAEDDRPREKLLLKGSHALSNAELIAIIINNGTKDESAISVAQKVLLASNNRLDDLAQMNVKQILNLKVKGVGPAKAIAIVAAMELAKRREVSIKKLSAVSSVDAAGAYLQAQLRNYKHEVFVVLYLDAGNRIIHEEVMSQGGLKGTVVDERIIIKRALEHNAVQLLLCHNHPGGTLRPSQADKHMTEKIKSAANLFSINILDHLIVTEESFYSFVSEGLL